MKVDEWRRLRVLQIRTRSTQHQLSLMVPSFIGAACEDSVAAGDVAASLLGHCDGG